MIGDKEWIRADCLVSGSVQNQHMIAQPSRSGPLVRDLNDSHVPPAEGLGEDTMRADNSRRPLPKRNAQSLRFRKPVFQEIGRPRQQLKTAGSLADIDCLFKDDVGHIGFTQRRAGPAS